MYLITIIILGLAVDNRINLQAALILHERWKSGVDFMRFLAFYLSRQGEKEPDRTTTLARIRKMITENQQM